MISQKISVMILVLIASVLVVTPLFETDMALSYGTGGGGGSGGSGGLLVCPPDCPDADIDIAEAVEAGNSTMMTNQTVNENMTGGAAPVRHPGQPPHEIVFALPLRDDGKIWSGKVTFTASKPVEVEILHPYNPQQNIDEKHGIPYHAVLPGNRSVAISHFRDLVEVPLVINGTSISSGTLGFVGSALLFHKTTGEPLQLPKIQLRPQVNNSIGETSLDSRLEPAIVE